MPRCDFCGKNVALPFHCPYCGKDFCDEHRLPPNHACANLAAWKKTPAPGVGIRYGAGGVSAYGSGGSVAAKTKKPAGLFRAGVPYFKIAIAIIVILIAVLAYLGLTGAI
ncbi:MAG: AN1-type zinc finger domain-containing protein [Methanoregula sp.]|nr:AN1-type zinc finger domain-containing protein [Methanoregula sp.]